MNHIIRHYYFVIWKGDTRRTYYVWSAKQFSEFYRMNNLAENAIEIGKIV